MSRNEVIVHPTSTIDARAQLAAGVSVGPHCFIGEKVRIGGDTRLSSNIYIDGRVEIGESCQFSPFSVIGTEPQDVGYREEDTCVKIGDRNIFREFITIHRGTEKGGGETRIGDDNYFMAYSHIAHDCRIGNSVVFTNAATLGGHVSVDDFAYLSAFCGVHQFCRIGKYAFVGGFTVITQDVLPFCKVAGMRPVLFYGLNAIGLRRRGFTKERIGNLKEMFRIIFFCDLNTTQAIEKIKTLLPPHEDREEIITFIGSSKRGIIKKAAPQWDDESAL